MTKEQPATKYIIEMYKHYHEAGEPTVKQVEEELKKIDRRDFGRYAEQLDLLAVAKVIDKLEKTEKGRDVEKVLRSTYMSLEKVSRGNISATARAAAVKYYMGEATVYRYMKKARIMAAEERKLRIIE